MSLGVKGLKRVYREMDDNIRSVRSIHSFETSCHTPSYLFTPRDIELIKLLEISTTKRQIPIITKRNSLRLALAHVELCLRLEND